MGRVKFRGIAVVAFLGLMLTSVFFARPHVMAAASTESSDAKVYDQVLIPDEKCWEYGAWEYSVVGDGKLEIEDINLDSMWDTLDKNKTYQLVIPAEIDGKKIFCVDMVDWYERYGKIITSVKVSEGIKMIKNLLYGDNVSNIKVLELPSSLETIEDSAFSGANALERVYIPENGNLEHIGSFAFGSCKNLKSIELPCSGSVETSSSDKRERPLIVGYAFSGCESLKKVKLCSTWDVEENAFRGCLSLESFDVVDTGVWKDFNQQENLYEKDGVLMKKRIEENPVYGDEVDEYGDVIIESYEQVEKNIISCWPGAKKGECILDAGTTFEPGAFSATKGLTSIQVDPQHEEYTSVDGVVYTKDMTRLLVCPAGKTGQLVVPEGVYALDNGCADAPFGYSSLTEISFPDSLCGKYTWDGYEVTGTFGGSSAFRDCDKLETIHLGKNIEASTVLNAFSELPSLKNITVSSENPYICAMDNIIYDKTGKTLLMIPLTRSGKLTLPDSVETNELTIYIGEGLGNEIISVKEPTITEITLGKNYKAGLRFRYDNYEIVDGEIVNASGAHETAEGAFRLATLENYYVSDENTTLAASNGILCSKDLKTIYHCPAGKKDTVILPLGVEKVISSAFNEYTDEFSTGDEVASCVMNLTPDSTVNKVNKIWEQVADYADADIVVRNKEGKILKGTDKVTDKCVISLSRGSGDSQYSVFDIHCVVQGGANAEQENSGETKVETLAAPKLGKIRSKAAQITGTAVTGSTVYVKIGSKTFKVKCKKKKFTLKVPKKYRKKLKKGTTVKAYAKKSGFKKSATVKKKVSA